jgi:hypothetical protein
MKGFFLIGMLVAEPPAAPTEEACAARLEKLIGETEGWGNPASLVRRQHNPGGLRLRSGEYARYLSDQEGWEALHSLISRYREWRWKWIQIIRVWSEVPDRYEAAIAPRFSACMAEP